MDSKLQTHIALKVKLEAKIGNGKFKEKFPATIIHKFQE